MKRKGVILGVTTPCSPEEAGKLIPLLEKRFPGVVFAIVDQAAGHIAFDFDDGTPEYPVRDYVLEQQLT